jgi:hypothetical protein
MRWMTLRVERTQHMGKRGGAGKTDNGGSKA